MEKTITKDFEEVIKDTKGNEYTLKGGWEGTLNDDVEGNFTIEGENFNYYDEWHSGDLNTFNDIVNELWLQNAECYIEVLLKFVGEDAIINEGYTKEEIKEMLKEAN